MKIWSCFFVFFVIGYAQAAHFDPDEILSAGTRNSTASLADQAQDCVVSFLALGSGCLESLLPHPADARRWIVPSATTCCCLFRVSEPYGCAFLACYCSVSCLYMLTNQSSKDAVRKIVRRSFSIDYQNSIRD